MDGKTTSSTKLYYAIASGVWFTMSLTLLITFLILILGDYPMNGLSEEAKSDDKLDCLTKYDYWYTWKESGLLGALLGGYFGLVH